MDKKSELYIIKEFESGDVLVGDLYGTTQYLTKVEYELYLENRKKLKDEKESDLQNKD
jgi:hypothetical protein